MTPHPTTTVALLCDGVLRHATDADMNRRPLPTMSESHVTPQLTTADVAELLKVTPATVRSYAARGVMPGPDGYLGRTPWWHRSTVVDWQRTRPGQGVGGGRPKKDLDVRPKGVPQPPVKSESP